MMKIFTLIILLLIISCTGIRQSHYNNVENKLTSKDYKGAIKIIQNDKSTYDENNRVLYYMNLGWVYHLAGASKDAQQALKKAGDYIDDLFTKSNSKTLTSTITSNDNILPFEGEDFEKISIPIFRALDYAYNNKFEDATIEARKINKDLKFLHKEREIKSAYQEDAFGRYLAGILYESQKEYNDAYLSYYKAYQAYKKYNKYYRIPIPTQLKQAIKRLMYKYANSGDINSLKEELKNIEPQNIKDKGRFVFIHYNGFAPKKEEASIKVYPRDYDSNSEYRNRINLVYPIFKVRRHRISYAKIYIDDIEYRTELVQPIDRIAIRDLKDRMVRDFPKMIAAEVLRIVAKDALRGGNSGRVCNYNRVTRRRECHYKSNNNDFGWGDVAAFALDVASNHADLRSWRFLPAEIELADIILPSGVYNIKVDFCDSNGYVIETTLFNNVTIKKGKETFKWYRTVR